MRTIWSTVEDVRNAKSNEELIAIGLMNWGNCYMEKPPEQFGMVMVEIGKRLNIHPSPENFHKLYEQWKEAQP